MNFHGSYLPSDVTFLLKPVDIKLTDVTEKERLIQSGQVHYSEMLSVEKTPDQRYMNLFHQAFELNGRRLARDIIALARTLAQNPGREVVLVSLARAGTPIGVLLQRTFALLDVPSVHYSVSIIRDRGIDEVALKHILASHSDRDIVFVDGWTGKGAIADELHKTVSEFNAKHGTAIDSGMAVVADLAGVAKIAATDDDYLIPSAILNSIVSGLISRSVLSALYVQPGDFHACAYYAEKEREDLSLWFVDQIFAHIETLLTSPGDLPQAEWLSSHCVTLKKRSDKFIKDMMTRFDVTDRNRVKPGIGESTRALLRRVPDRLLVKEAGAADVAHLVALAETNQVPVEIDPSLAYRAAVIIKTLGE